MKTIGKELLSNLKSDTILKRKPNLKICSNHRKDNIAPKRICNKGTAHRDGKGWYI